MSLQGHSMITRYVPYTVSVPPDVPKNSSANVWGRRVGGRLLGAVINGKALIYFIIKGLVVWPLALLIVADTVLGGYAGARLAKRVNQRNLQMFIVAVGLFVSAWLFFR